MNILVSNDDGILAPGLAVLAEACRSVGQVTVVAPDREQSGTSHSLTLHRPLRPVLRHDGAYQIDGTPTDCVLLGVQALLPIYAIGSALLIGTWLEGGKIGRALASAWCVLAPAWGAWFMVSHPREVLDRADVAKANDYLAHNDGNSFVDCNDNSCNPMNGPKSPACQ